MQSILVLVALALSHLRLVVDQAGHRHVNDAEAGLADGVAPVYILVVGGIETLIEQTHALQSGPGDGQRRSGDEISVAHLIEAAIVGFVAANVVRLGAGAIDEAPGVLDGAVRVERLTTGDADRGILESVHQRLKPSLPHDCVLIEQHQHVPRSSAQPDVVACREAQVALVADQLHLGVTLRHEVR